MKMFLSDPEANAINFSVQPHRRNNKRIKNLQPPCLEISRKRSQTLNNKGNQATLFS